MLGAVASILVNAFTWRTTMLEVAPFAIGVAFALKVLIDGPQLRTEKAALGADELLEYDGNNAFDVDPSTTPASDWK